MGLLACIVQGAASAVQRAPSSADSAKAGRLDTAMLRLARALDPGSKATQRIEVNSNSFHTTNAPVFIDVRDTPVGVLYQIFRQMRAVPHRNRALVPQVVEELVGYLQAARMLAAAAAKAQPPTEELAALAPNGAAAQAPQEMDIDGASMLYASATLLLCSYLCMCGSDDVCCCPLHQNVRHHNG